MFRPRYLLPLFSAVLRDPTTLIPAAITTAGTLIGGDNTNSAASSNAFAQEQFQAQMSNTAYQRGVADMKKAGINPMLASQVGGASTPGGAMAPVVNSLGNAMQAGIGNYSALQSAQQTAANIDNTKANTAKTIAETANVPSPSASPVATNLLGPVGSKKLSAAVSSAGDVFDGTLSGPMAKAASIIDSIRGNSGAALDSLGKELSPSAFADSFKRVFGFLSPGGVAQPNSANDAGDDLPPSQGGPQGSDAYYRDFLSNGGM